MAERAELRFAQIIERQARRLLARDLSLRGQSRAATRCENATAIFRAACQNRTHQTRWRAVAKRLTSAKNRHIRAAFAAPEFPPGQSAKVLRAKRQNAAKTLRQPAAFGRHRRQKSNPKRALPVRNGSAVLFPAFLPSRFLPLKIRRLKYRAARCQNATANYRTKAPPNNCCLPGADAG